MKLPELQQRFAAAILADAPGAIMESIEKNAISPAERLSVYRNNVMSSLSDALADSFSATRKLVGDDFFHSMARQFVVNHPPAIANLNLYGGDFPDFIGNYVPARDLPYLADVARFEWLWNEAYLAEDDAALTPEDMAAKAPEDYPAMHLRLRRSVRLLAATYPVDAIWRWCEHGGNAPDITAGDIFLLLSRPDLEVETLRLTRPEYRMLLALLSGNNFEDAAGQALQEDASFDLSAFLSRVFAIKLFQTFTS